MYAGLLPQSLLRSCLLHLLTAGGASNSKLRPLPPLPPFPCSPLLPSFIPLFSLSPFPLLTPPPLLSPGGISTFSPQKCVWQPGCSSSIGPGLPPSPVTGGCWVPVIMWSHWRVAVGNWREGLLALAIIALPLHMPQT